MGTWGFEPWENDAAADWFGDLFEATALHEHVLKTLQLDAVENADEIRAAAFILTQLGCVYIWPIDSLDEALAVAERKLNELMASTDFWSNGNSDGVKSALENELEAVRRRLRALS